MHALDDLADRLEAAASAMATLGPELERGEPWPLTETYGPGPESSWGPREVLAHCVEMLPYWMGEIERILDGDPAGTVVAFGRTEADDIRVAIIGRDRRFPTRELLSRVVSEAGRVARRLRQLDDAAPARIGAHVTRGDLSVRDIAERFMTSHLEGHADQLRSSLIATG